MSITYRVEKGSPLTTEEIDSNFRELEMRLKVLENHPEGGEGVGKIHIEEDQIKFIGTFGTDFGAFALPKPALNLCGVWLAQTPYRKRDLVTVENALYCCNADHMSTTWAHDLPFWKQVLTLSPSPPHALPVYEKASLPEVETLGKLALLIDEEGSTLIFFNGNTWQRLMKGETL